MQPQISQRCTVNFINPDVAVQLRPPAFELAFRCLCISCSQASAVAPSSARIAVLTVFPVRPPNMSDFIRCPSASCLLSMYGLYSSSHPRPRVMWQQAGKSHTTPAISPGLRHCPRGIQTLVCCHDFACGFC